MQPVVSVFHIFIRTLVVLSQMFEEVCINRTGFINHLSRKDVKLTSVYLSHDHHFYLSNIGIMLADFQGGGASQFSKHC